MKLSARNILKGTVKSINHGAVNPEVVITLPGGGENRFNNHEVIRQIAGVSRRRTRLRGSKSLKRHGGSGLKPEFHSIIKK
jgi:hypothetical protein